VHSTLAGARADLSPRRRLRAATQRARLLPSFLIVGAQRAGTTSLFDYLSRHPDVVGPGPADDSVAWLKELRFFSERFWRGIGWYRSFFPTVARRRLARVRGGDLVAGEATPYYLFHPAVPERVAATIPEVRLIALLRDPVERAYSHYRLMCRQGHETLSFGDALEAEGERLAGTEERLLSDPRFRSRHHRWHSYVARGLYADQLERWLAYFPREQLLVLRTEDFLARPAEIYADVLQFLGLRERPLGKVRYRNRADPASIDPALRARLERRFAEPNARLARLLGRDLGWEGTSSAAEHGAEGESTTLGLRAGGP
jgi:Sulfotransferase domain